MDKYCNCKLVGLYNLGNTCFINSCIQILNNTYELHHILDKQPIQKLNYYSKLTIEWNSLRDLMWSDNGTVKPTRFLKTIQYVSHKLEQPLFTGYSQNDISEFLGFFLNCLHETYSRKVNVKVQYRNPDYDFCCKYLQDVYEKEFSEINNVFNGIYVNTITEIDSNTVLSKSPEMFSTINIPVFSNNKAATTLDECFSLFHQKELLEKDNAWYNEKTKKHQSVFKKTTIWRFPNVMIIVLKRFNHRNRKIQHKIDFPLINLNLQKYSCENIPSFYDCFGICNHSGNVNGGHYTSFSKNSQGKWYFYNDKEVQIVKDHSCMISEQAYCLFYRKK